MKRKLMGLIMCLMLVFTLVSPVAVNAADYSASRIVNYVNGRVGESYARGYCLRFVDESFQNIYGFREYSCCAYKCGSTYLDSASRDIPLGACVFFGGSDVTCSCGNRAGHIGIYVGNGNIVHAWAGNLVSTSIDYVVSCGYPYRGWGWLCDIALTTGNPNPPSNPRISLSKTSLAAGETLTVNYSATNATNYRVGIWHNNALQVVERGSSTSAQITLSEAGGYVIHVQCMNAYGSVDTESIEVVVYASAPSNPRISLSKTFLASGEILTINYSATNANNYRVGIWHNNELQVVERGSATSAQITLSEAGGYVIHVQCMNAFGSIDTQNIGVSVYDSAPKNCKISVKTIKGYVNEPIEFNMSADYAERYSLNVYRNDVNIYNYRYIEEGNNKNYPISFSEPGTYKVYAVAYNYYNLCESEPVYITIEEDTSKPSSDFTVQKYTGYANITNNTSEYQEPSVIFAKYNNGVLADTKVYKAHIPAEQTLKIDTDFGNDYKVFVWDSLSGMKPLCEIE